MEINIFVMSQNMEVYVIGDYNAHFSFDSCGYSHLLDSWYSKKFKFIKNTANSKSKDTHMIINSQTIRDNLSSILPADPSNHNIAFFILQIGTTDAKPANFIRSYTYQLQYNTYVEPAIYKNNMVNIIETINASFPNALIFVITPLMNNNLYYNQEYIDIIRIDIPSRDNPILNNSSLSKLVIVDMSFDTPNNISNNWFNLNNIIINPIGQYNIFNQITSIIKNNYSYLKPINIK